MRYFIYTYPSRYYRQNIYDTEILNDISFEEACEEARSLGYEVIQNYMRPEEEIYSREEYLDDIGADEWDDDYEEGYYESLDYVILDEIDYEVYEIKEDTSEDIIRDYNMNRIDPKDFIRDYCYSASETVARSI